MGLSSLPFFRFVVCCRPCEALKVCIGDFLVFFLILFMGETPNSRSGQHLLWVPLWETFVFHATLPFLLSRAVQFKGPELCDSWSERGYTHREEVLKLKITLYPFTSLDLDSKSPLTSFQNLNNSSVAEVLLQRWVICRDSSEVLEVNEITVRYIQGGYFVLLSLCCLEAYFFHEECSGEWRTAVWSSVGLSTLACVPLCCRGGSSATVRALFPWDNHLACLCITKSPYSISWFSINCQNSLWFNALETMKFITHTTLCITF